MAAGDVVRADPRAERAGGRRPDRRPAGAAGQDFQYTVNTLGPAHGPGTVRARSSSRRTPMARSCVLRDVGRVELGAQNYDVEQLSRRQAGRRRWACSNCRAPTRSKRRTSFDAKMKRLKQRFPRRARIRDPLRHDRVHPQDRWRASCTRCSRPSCWCSSSCSSSCKTGGRRLIPLIGRARLARRHVRRNEGAGLLAQQPLDVRAGAGHRRGGRRRDRRRGKRRTLDRARACRRARRPFKSMDEVTVAVIAVAFGLSAVFIPTAFISGITGPVLSPIRLDDRRLDVDFGIQLADAQPGLGGAVAQAARGAKRDPLTWLHRPTAFGWFFSGFNRVFRVDDARSTATW